MSNKKLTYEQALARLHSADQKHHFHPFTDPKFSTSHAPFVMDAANGAYVWGQNIQLFDGMAGLGNVNIGYGRPEMAKAADEAVREISYYHNFASMTTPAPARLAQMLADRMPEGFEKFFFTNSGSEANETILKFIRLYWKLQGRPEKKIVITRDYAYHGSTMATTALNGRKDMLDQFGINEDWVRQIESPYWYRNAVDQNKNDYGLKAAQAFEDMIVKVGADNVGAIFIEPIQGTGGIIIPPETYLPEITRIARKHDILIVADEVLTGIGRGGDWVISPEMGLQPDFIALAKGLSSGYAPIAAVAVRDSIMDVLEQGAGMLNHGFTTGGHPIASRLAVANLEIIEKENLIHRVAKEIGPYFADKMGLMAGHPLVGEVRSKGLMVGVEIVKNSRTKEQFPIERAVDDQVANALLMKGIISRPVGNTLVFCPPFIMNEREAAYIAASLFDALDEVQKMLKATGEI